MKRLTYGGHLMIRFLCVLLALVFAGCEKRSLQVETGSSVPVPQTEGVPAGALHCAQIEKVLERNIRDFPISRRYAAVTQKADDLWKLLDHLPSNDKEYTILVAARFQRELEAELKDIEVPRKTIDLGQRHISKDGTHYYMATRKLASAAAKEQRSIDDVREYRKQLQHFLARYPNRLDSKSMKKDFETLSPDKKIRVMERIVELLGKRPIWATE